MKKILTSFFLFATVALFAQKDCDYSINVNDSLGIYKVTNEYLMSEKIFAGKSEYIFFSLVTDNGLPALTVNLIQKSKAFLSANCFDKNSKLYLQLQNGKVITMVHQDKESCGSLIRDPNGFDNRVTIGTFLFVKGTMEELKSSPINLMRIKYLTTIEDYVVKKEITSEMNQKVYQPETFFMDYLQCIQ
ncbi:hypothetical protein FFWV33_12340 [Flavobacterium faecale]|uniref:Lipocalin-like domain-containing protein n=1 Tax=Flavobacterium faecale TaxID=1355330 RepID=A0A2S1LEP4_9FLAO|nr:hypothetical protein [Flavobacterium faecale]AWG22250.1 hypothetical protein FFWV33_12340 [Flavobacterium faecale]